MADGTPGTPVSEKAPTRILAVAREAGLPEEVLRDLVDHPHRTEEILRDAVGDLEADGRSDRAQRLVEALRDHPVSPESGQYASIDLVRMLDGSGEDAAGARADRILEELLRPGNLLEGPADVLAGYFRRAENREKALYCYNIASRGLLARSAESLAGLGLVDLVPLVGRARVREELGLALDAHDRFALAVVERYLRENSDAFDWDGESPGRGGDGFRPEASEPVQEVRAAFSRESLEKARSLGLLSPETDGREPDAYYLDTERALRGYSRKHPGTPVYTLLAGADEIAAFARDHGLDPADEATRRAWAQDRRDDFWILPWPPERNQRCWCASGRKYKKCCGSPAHH
ncbi:SEC-C domain-containing protein [Nocardiopsis quinghaiensis]|uniref:SEC-C domain-containing protein n=1 Tax=Nocardiopsis quinghaiensis TaxID=464995 RepID=UPI0012391E93|nr:SEC-C domain-containing protein [Nocardiopsis quinghaiensis]